MQSLFGSFVARPERAIVFLGLVLLLAGNWILPLTDRDEARFAEASREMIQRGDYVVPWFNGQWRFDKPILIYWCQSTAYRVFGENAFAARLPSALFTTGIALLLVRWGRKMADPKTGFLAGAMFLTGLHVAIIGRVATADMAMVFFYALAVWTGWELTRPQRSWRPAWWLAFYVIMVFGFWAKGPEAWLPVLGLALGRWWYRDSFRLPFWETFAGLSLTAGLTALWGIPALLQTHGQYLDIGIGEHVIHRSTGVNDGHGLAGVAGFIATLPLYFVTFLVSFLPWTLHQPARFQPWLSRLRQKGTGGPLLALILDPLLWLGYIPAKIWQWWPGRKRDIFGWYLMMQVFIVFVVFSLVRTKLPHYTMPAFPCIALWLALQLRSEPNAFAWFQRRFVIMFVFFLVLMLGLAQIPRQQFLARKLWRELGSQVQPQTKLGCFGYVEPTLVWEFRGVITNTVTLGDVKNAPSFLTNTPPYILVLPTKDLSVLPDTNGTLVHVRGFDVVRFKNWDLTAIIR